MKLRPSTISEPPVFNNGRKKRERDKKNLRCRFQPLVPSYKGTRAFAFAYAASATRETVSGAVFSSVQRSYRFYTPQPWASLPLLLPFLEFIIHPAYGRMAVSITSSLWKT